MDWSLLNNSNTSLNCKTNRNATQMTLTNPDGLSGTLTEPDGPWRVTNLDGPWQTLTNLDVWLSLTDPEGPDYYKLFIFFGRGMGWSVRDIFLYIHIFLFWSFGILCDFSFWETFLKLPSLLIKERKKKRSKEPQNAEYNLFSSSSPVCQSLPQAVAGHTF